MIRNNLLRLVWVIPPLLLILNTLGIGPFKSEWLLVLVFCAAGSLAWMSYQLNHESVSVFSVLFGLVCLVTNPLVPIHLSRNSWMLIDIGVAVIFATHFFSEGSRKAPTE